MARVASGKEVLEQAKGLPVNAKTIEESRQAQAVVLPLEFGLSMEQTTTAIGTSIGWACQLRARLIRNGGIRDTAKPARGGRRRQNLSREEKVAFFSVFYRKSIGRRYFDCERNQAGIGRPLKAQDVARRYLQACCTAMAGASWLLTSVIPKQTCSLKTSEKNFKIPSQKLTRHGKQKDNCA